MPAKPYIGLVYPPLIWYAREAGGGATVSLSAVEIYNDTACPDKAAVFFSL